MMYRQKRYAVNSGRLTKSQCLKAFDTLSLLFPNQFHIGIDDSNHYSIYGTVTTDHDWESQDVRNAFKLLVEGLVK